MIVLKRIIAKERGDSCGAGESVGRAHLVFSLSLLYILPCASYRSRTAKGGYLARVDWRNSKDATVRWNRRADDRDSRNDALRRDASLRTSFVRSTIPARLYAWTLKSMPPYRQPVSRNKPYASWKVYTPYVTRRVTDTRTFLAYATRTQCLM